MFDKSNDAFKVITGASMMKTEYRLLKIGKQMLEYHRKKAEI